MSALCLLLTSACSSDGSGSSVRESASPAAKRDAEVAQAPLDAGRERDAALAGPQRDARSELCVPLSQDDDCAETPASPREDAAVEEPRGAGMVSCDARKVLCKRSPPVCADGQFPSVVETCWGGCVRFDRCACRAAAECPQPEQYTCHMSAAHCGPFVN